MYDYGIFIFLEIWSFKRFVLCYSILLNHPTFVKYSNYLMIKWLKYSITIHYDSKTNKNYNNIFEKIRKIIHKRKRINS